MVTARHGLTGALGAEYRALPAPASDCLECGVCTERCPFGVDVVAQMGEATHLFEC